MSALDLAGWIAVVLAAIGTVYVVAVMHGWDERIVGRFDRWRHERGEVKRLRAADRLAAEERGLDMVRGFREPLGRMNHPTMRDDEVT